MHTRFRMASAFALALLAMPGASGAQQADSVATRGPLPGRGSIGGQVGSSYILANSDYSKGAQPRLSFVGHFRYVINKSWGWQVSPSFTWNGYVSHVDAPFVDVNFPAEGLSKQHYLTQVLGASGQLQWFTGSGRTRWHVGAGPAFYRVVVQKRRKVVEDPITRELHSGLHMGATAEIGYERFLQRLPNTSVEATVAGIAAFAQSDNRFVSGWNGNPMLLEVRLGAHYYYEFRKPKPKSTKPGLGR
jgi:hypothetical protein